MMHEYRGSRASMPALLILFFFFFFSLPCWVSRTYAEMAMKQLSREELVRIAGYGEERLSSVLVVGTLLCDACMEPDSVSGANVAVACKTDSNTRKINWVHGTTDEYGDFMVDLPSHLHATPRLEDACIVKVLHIPKNSSCRLIPGIKPRGIKLSSVGNGIRVYSAGTLRLNELRNPSQKCSGSTDDDTDNLVEHKHSENSQQRWTQSI